MLQRSWWARVEGRHRSGLRQDAGEFGEAAIDSAVDLSCAVIPFVPAGASKAARAADKANDISKAGRAPAGIGASSLANGRITVYTKHGLNQAIGREGTGVSSRAILDAVKNPAQVIQQSGGRVKYIGQNATVITNSEGKTITTWPNGSGGLRGVGGGG